MSNFSKFVYQMLVVVIAVNIFGLWGVSFLQQRQLQKLQTDYLMVSSQAKATVQDSRSQDLIDLTQVVPVSSDSANQNTTATLSSQLTQLNQTLNSFDSRLDTLETDVENIQQNPSAPSSSSISGAKEYDLFIGTGSSNNLNWTTVDSTEITIDTTKYPTIKSAKFEAGLSIIGGEARARLLNKTTLEVIPISEVMHNTSTTTWKTSSSFAIPSGTHTFQVQLRSSSGERAYLGGSRLKLSVE